MRRTAISWASAVTPPEASLTMKTSYPQWNLGGRELGVVKIPAVLLVVSGNLRRRSAVNAPNPPRQVALVGKACSGCDFRQAAAAIAHKLKSAP